MSQRVASSALYSTVGIGMQGLSRLGYTVVIGRTLGTETLGHASALMSLSIFVALFWPTAAGNTASRFLAVALHERVSDAVINSVLGRATLGASLGLGLLSIPVALGLGNDLSTAVTGAWLVVGYGLYAYTRGAQLGYHRAARIALWDTLSSLLSLGLLAAVALGGLSALVLVPLALAYTVFAIACWPRGNDQVGAAVAPRRMLQFAAWNVLAGLTTNGLLQVAMLSAQVYGTGDEAGVFAAAFTLATPASMLGQAVSQIVLPAFAHRGASTILRDRATLTFFLGFTALAAVAFGLIAVASPWALPLIYPTQGAAAVPVLQFLMIGVFVFTVGLIPAALLLSAGRSRAVALASIVGFGIGVGVVVMMGPHHGTSAGSTGFLVGSTVNLVAMIGLGLQRVPSSVSSDRGSDEATRD